MKMDVVTGYDSDFAQHLTIMLLLLADTNLGHSFAVFVLWSGTPAEQQKLQEVAAPTPVRVHFIEIKRETLADLVLRPIFSEMIYARLLMRDLLPRELDKMLYLNSHILVHGDIDELWATGPPARRSAPWSTYASIAVIARWVCLITHSFQLGCAADRFAAMAQAA